MQGFGFIMKFLCIVIKLENSILALANPSINLYKLNQTKIIQMNSAEAITKRLDKLPFSKWHLMLILGIGTIWIFDGYQVSLVSLFSKYILNDHSETQYRALATAYQLGCIIGSVAFGFLAYYHGRRPIFMITLLIYAAGVIFCLNGQVFELFVIGRILTGLSVGGQFTAVFTAVDEFLPPNVRGRANIAIDGTWHLGASLGSIINMILGEFQNWRYLFAVGLIGIVGLACIRKNIPQSPRWLLMRNREAEAQKIVSGIEYSVLNNSLFYQESPSVQQQLDSASRESPINEQNEQLSQQLEPTSQQNLDEGANGILMELKVIAFRYKKRLFISCFLIYSQSFYFNLVYYEYPIILKDRYNLSQREISTFMLPLSICSFISTLLVGPFFDILGRRRMVLITYVTTGILLICSIFLTQNLIGLEVIYCIMFMFGSPASSSANLIASQIFPTSTRPIVLSLIFIIGMFGGMCGVWVNNHYVSAALMIIGGILGFWLCPQAENKSLEQLNQIGNQQPI